MHRCVNLILIDDESGYTCFNNMHHLHSLPTGELLQIFLSTEDESLASSALEELITNQAGPVVRKIIGRKFKADPNTEDIVADTLLHLIAKLRKLRSTQAMEKIESFTDYVAVLTFNRCNQHLRKLYPGRRRVMNRIRYIVSHHRDLALWQQDPHEVCGFTDWRNPVANLKEVEIARLPQDISSLNPADQLRAALHNAGGPVSLDHLIAFFQHLWGMSDEKYLISLKTHGDVLENVSDPSSGVDVTAERLQFLNRLWKEVLELPLKQRIALLLHLRDENGSAILGVFPLSGIATFEELSNSVQMPEKEFAELWLSMPLDDFHIAEILGVTRQQVINLRRSARERLMRRLGGFQ